MPRFNRMVDVGGRKFRGGAGLAAAGAAVSTMVPPQAKAAPAAARVEYPADRLAHLADLKPDGPLAVAYPDADAPGVPLQLGKRVPSGVGPGVETVGLTTTC